MRMPLFVIILLLAQFAGMNHAQLNTQLNYGKLVSPTDLTQNLCVDLFGQIGPNGQVISGGLKAILPGLSDFATYNFMLQFSLEIVLVVLLIIAVMYGIGTAFGLPRVLSYVRTEYLESILNIVIIVILFGGMAVLGGVISFIGNLGSAVVSASGVQTVGSGYILTSAGSVATVPQLYNSICTVYFNDAVLHFGGLSFLSGITLIYNIMQGITISVMPNGMGFSFSPFNGLTPFQQVLSFMTPLISGAIIVEIGIIFLLALIYYLFPLFLFTGILLRCFPWTRAAGGTLLALFIGFYLFFPALLYPFASVDYRCLAAQQTLCAAQGQQNLNLPPVPTTLTDVFKNLATAPGSAWTFLREGEFVALLDFWIFSIINASFQIFGVVISFVISYNLLEGFADLLGAPSLSAKNLLRNLI